jgi:uncharacterized protein (TIGR02145 family)
MKNVKFTLFSAGVVLAMAFTLSCSEAQAAGQSDFYGVWVKGSMYFEINKETITAFQLDDNNLKKHKYRIVKWEKGSKDKNFIVYALDEEDKKTDFKVSIDAYSDLQISAGGRSYEAKKASAAEQKELNKAIKEAAAREAAEKTAREAIAQKAAKAVVQRGSFSDQRDGKTYKTVKIGSQTWMSENLNYDASGSKCYENKPENCAKYGRLYNWATSKSACPSGWHLPSNDEWQELVDFTGGDELAGAYLKAKSGWNDNKGASGNGTDNYGFSALPGGFGYSSGSFNLVGYFGNWWSATEYGASGAYFRTMRYISANVYRDSDSKYSLYSVRCVQD